MPTATLERNPALVRAATYRRPVGASLERVWENVHDWEHLPWLHGASFTGIELKDAGRWGWRADLRYAGGGRGELELCVDDAAQRYVARALTGVGAGGEVWTTLRPRSPDATDIEVEFLVPPVPDDDTLARVGEAYVALYTRLWDEDEAMMRHREAALRRVPAVAAGQTLALGAEADLRARLPLVVELGGRRFCLAALGDELVVHAADCPHWRGPLEGALGADGRLVCPWHGYAFDARTGRSCDGRGLRLAPFPRLERDERAGSLRLVVGADA